MQNRCWLHVDFSLSEANRRLPSQRTNEHVETGKKVVLNKRAQIEKINQHGMLIALNTQCRML